MGVHLVSAVVVLVVLVGACGDSAPTKEAFLAEADPICKPVTDAALAMTTPVDLPSLRTFYIALADGADKTITAVDKLDFPGGADGEAARAWLTSLREASVAARELPRHVDTSNFAAVETGATKAAELFRAANSQARTYGSAECGRGEADAVERMAKALSKAMKDAMVRAVDEVCRSAWVGIERLDAPKDFAQAKAYLQEATTRIDKAVAGIRALAAPSTDKALLDELLVAMEALVAQYKELVTAAQPSREGLAKVSDLTDKVEASARAFGVYHCSRMV